jgi:hypothetical protein
MPQKQFFKGCFVASAPALKHLLVHFDHCVSFPAGSLFRSLT